MKVALTRKTTCLFIAFMMLLTVVAVLCTPSSAQAAPFLVTVTTDTLPLGGPGELRTAINAANAAGPGPHTISFAIPPGPPVQTIALAGPLPVISVNQLYINGASQPGTNLGANPIVLMVELDCTLAAGQPGLVFGPGSDGGTVDGLIINRSPSHGIMVDQAALVGIESCFIGTDSTGMAPGPGNAGAGIYLDTTANPIIGGTAPSEMCVISFNTGNGVEFFDTDFGFVTSSFIGTSANGGAGLPNFANGVYIHGDSNNNTIGGTSGGERNIISANGNSGVRIEGEACDENAVLGNYIGLDGTGAVDLGNTEHGVYVYNGPDNTDIGSAAGTGRNVISGNDRNGVKIEEECTGNDVMSNLIGLNALGTVDMGNAWSNIYIAGSDMNRVGSDAPGEGNYICGGDTIGVELADSDSNTVAGNGIGVGPGGMNDFGNSAEGVYVRAGSDLNTLGGITTQARNVVACNDFTGVRIEDSNTNTLVGNYIGVGSDGATDRGNGFDGILVTGTATGNTVGGGSEPERNLISGNDGDGVEIAADGNFVYGNYIGTDAAGAVDVGNAQYGVRVSQGAANNIIGAELPFAGNLISGNDTYGMLISMLGSDNNVVKCNFIGTNAAGAGAISNSMGGVYVFDSATNNTIGGLSPAQRNIISGNNGPGVIIENADTNFVSANYIGTNATGTGAVSNGGGGVTLSSQADHNTVGGDTAGEGNLISGNGQSGINIQNPGANSNVISANFIGTDATGNAPLVNTMDGIRVWSDDDSNVIGGDTAAERNVISGNAMAGIQMMGGADSTVIQGNYIGVGADGTTDVGNAFGIQVSDGDLTVIGGAGAGNVIAFNNSQGVYLRTGSSQSEITYNTIRDNGDIGVGLETADCIRDRVSRNSIYGNTGLAIDIMCDGVTPNDGNNNNPGKANRGYNFPVFTSALYPPDGTVAVSGTAPGDSVVELFKVPGTPDASGHGQALTYLASVTATAGGTFSTALTGLVPGDRVTATATSPASAPAGDGNTSEMSANALVVRTAPTIVSITPSSGTNDGAVGITNLAGTGFYGTPAVALKKTGQADINATNVVVVSSTTITCTFDLTGAAPGAWSVFLQNQDAQTATMADAFTVVGGKNAWYLAEGTTDYGFDTYINIENPNSTAVTAAVTYMTKAGPVPRADITLPAASQTVINPRADLGSTDFSTRVECKEYKTICVDRRMIWTGQGAASPEGHSSVGVTSPATTWYLAEGSSRWGFETWLLIQNPNAVPANCTLTYMTSDAGPIPITHQVPANTRASYSMETDIGQRDASIKMEADVPVIPERAMYRNNRREGHDSIGTTAAANNYYLAEGTTDWGFTTYVLVQNPNAADNTVTITYMTPQGPVPQAPISVPANSRQTTRVNDALPGKDLSIHVQGTLPLIAERAMYWDAGKGEACHDSIGMDAPHSTFYLPDGESQNGYETWTLVQNPNAADVQVEVSYLTTSGQGNVTRTETVPASSRRTFNLAEHSGIVGRASVVVTCKTAGAKVMVERAMYWSNRGAGTDTIGGYGD